MKKATSSLKGVLANLTKGARSVLKGTASWRVLAVVAVVVALLAWLAAMAWKREAYEKIPDKLRQSVRRQCKDGAVLGEIWKDEWSMYRRDKLEEACKAGIGYNAGQRTWADGRTGADGQVSVTKEECQSKGFEGVCMNTILRGTKPCRNDKKECCLKNGKGCVSARTANTRFRMTQKNKGPAGAGTGTGTGAGTGTGTGASSSASSGGQSGKGVQFISDSGDSFDLTQGGVKAGEVHNMWIWDDKVDRVVVPRGKKVILYADPNGQGDQLKLGPGDHNLKKYLNYNFKNGGWWSTNATSYKFGGTSLFMKADTIPALQEKHRVAFLANVYPTPATPATPATAPSLPPAITYYGAGGVTQDFNEVGKLYNDLGPWQDIIERIHVPDGRKLYIYEHRDKGGNNRLLGPGMHELSHYTLIQNEWSGPDATRDICGDNDKYCWRRAISSIFIES